jgi:alkanesulfonate monooxygenase SsuD/methylene tetrahydromethanopterin reductase-like flavin-dependent oxidoreductase (luciferase family)
MCLIGDTDEEAMASLPPEVKALFHAMSRQKSLQGSVALTEPATQQWQALINGLIGSPETIRRRIAAYEAAGVQELRLFFPDAVYQTDSLRRFAKEFIV